MERSEVAILSHFYDRRMKQRGEAHPLIRRNGHIGKTVKSTAQYLTQKLPKVGHKEALAAREIVKYLWMPELSMFS